MKKPRPAASSMYHDPYPPFETDGRGRVVWSNSSEQIQLQLWSSPQVTSSNDGASAMREKENGGATGPRNDGKCNANDKVDGDGQDIGVESSSQVRVAP